MKGKMSLKVSDLIKFGIPKDNVKIVNTVNDIKKSVPNMVVAECVKSIGFIQNKFKLQHLKKKVVYCMSLGIYAQLKYDESHGIKILKPAKFKFKNVYKPYNGQNLNNKKILFWRTGGAGDLTFCEPITRYIKNKYKNCKIYFACGPQYRCLVENFKCVDKILDLPFPSNILFEVDYHAIFEGVIERTREAEKINAYELFSKSLCLDIPKNELVPRQSPKDEIVSYAKNTLKDWNLLNKPFILIQPRASSPIRTPRTKFWVELIENIVKCLDCDIVIIDSPHQKKKIDQFILGLDSRNRVYNYCYHSKSLDYMIAMASLSSLNIATDSSLIHMSASVGNKTFGIYGPFTPEIRMSTYPKSDWIVPEKYNCSGPCFKHGSILCKYANKKASPCFDNINIDKCIDKIKKLLNDG